MRQSPPQLLKRGKEMRFFEKGDDVIVKDPTDDNSLYKNGFIGTVVSFKQNDIVVVEDQDGDCWDVDYCDLEVPKKKCIIITNEMIVGVLDALVSTAKSTTSLENVYNDNVHHSEPNHSYSWAEVEEIIEYLKQKESK